MAKDIQRAHDGIKDPRCEVCMAKFTKVNDLEIHKTLHFGKDSLQCYICDKNFGISNF